MVLHHITAPLVFVWPVTGNAQTKIWQLHPKGSSYLLYKTSSWIKKCINEQLAQGLFPVKHSCFDVNFNLSLLEVSTATVCRQGSVYLVFWIRSNKILDQPNPSRCCSIAKNTKVLLANIITIFHTRIYKNIISMQTFIKILSFTLISSLVLVVRCHVSNPDTAVAQPLGLW